MPNFIMTRLVLTCKTIMKNKSVKYLTVNGAIIKMWLIFSLGYYYLTFVTVNECFYVKPSVNSEINRFCVMVDDHAIIFVIGLKEATYWCI